MTFALATVETASGPRAAFIMGDRFADVAEATGRARRRRHADAARGLGGQSRAPRRCGRQGQTRAARRRRGCSRRSATRGRSIAPAPITPTMRRRWPPSATSRRRPTRTRSGCAPGISSRRCTRSPRPTPSSSCILASKKIDWEAELAVVIGKKGRHMSEQDALSHVMGFCDRQRPLRARPRHARGAAGFFVLQARLGGA